MKMDILSREIADITITDDLVAVSISHGQVKKTIKPITVEHEVLLDDDFGDVEELPIADAIVMAVAAAHKRVDEALAAIKGLEKL